MSEFNTSALKHKSDYFTAWHNRGVALDNLGQYEEAIASFDQALKHKSDYFTAWHNRGAALAILGRCKESVASFDQVLKHKLDDHETWVNRGVALNNMGWYEEELVNYQAGLKAVRQPSQSEGWGKLHRAIGNAYYRQGKRSESPFAAWRDAKRSYLTALPALTADFPDSHLRLVQDLVQVLLALGQADLAWKHLEPALALFHQRYDQKPYLHQKRQFEAKFPRISQYAVDLLVKRDRPDLALETAEYQKNRTLAHILERAAEKTYCPSHAQMRQLLTPTTAIVSWHLSPHALTTFVLLPHESEPIVLSSPKSLDEFTQWQKDWDQHYTDYRQTKTANANHPWRTNLAANLDQLKQILEIDAIEPHLTSITHLILVPHRDLHRFPLHVLFPHYTCTHLPSLQVGFTLQQLHPHPPALAGKSLLNIDDPATGLLDPLPYAQLESALIRQLINGPTTLHSQTQATATAAIAALQQPHAIFHFTGHGEYNFRQPQNSRLALAQQTHLTAAEISPLNLEPYQLICIAACETALTGRETIETEYVGLVSAFLKAKAANVLSTLWVVNEISSAWLMIRFYQLLLSPKTPTSAIALQQAQTWLRTRTTADLLLWIADIQQFMSTRDPDYCKDLQDEITALQSKLDTMEATPADCPYENPYHWAAFTLTGTPYESH